MLEDNEEVENRACKGDCCPINQAPNIAVNNYKFIKNECTKDDECCEEKRMNRRDMINQIRSLDFAIVELAQYLDTHVDDKRAIALHNKYANELHELKEKYQKVYGPLTIKFPCNKWRWIEEPWPWERGNY